MATTQQKIIDSLIAKIEANPSNWIKCWASSPVRNAISNRPYSGINHILLTFSMRGSTWMTYNQMKELGGSNKGVKGEIVVKKGTGKSKKEVDKNGDPKTYQFFKAYYVWPVSEIKDLPEKYYEAEKNAQSEKQENNNFENLIANFPCPIIYGGDQPCFSLQDKKIFMPHPESFFNTNHFYRSLCHEMGHAVFPRGDEKSDKETYAIEERIVEFSAIITCARLGINVEEAMDNSAAYIAGWGKALKNEDPKNIMAVVRRAQEISNAILAHCNEMVEA